MINKKYWKDNDCMADYYEKEMEYLRTLNTVEEVEKVHCVKCADNGHWGWCDAPWITCPLKWRIKEILGVTENRYNTIREQLPELF